MKEKATTRIDRANVAELAQLERNLKKSLTMNVSLFHKVISQHLLNRVHCRQMEWAERNFSKAEIQMDYHQLLQTNGIEPPII